MKLRVLSIGQHLAHPSIVNTSLRGADSFSDFDAIVINPLVFFELWENRTTVQSDGERRTCKASDGGFGNEILRIINRRESEVDELLKLGGLVICFIKFRNIQHMLHCYARPYTYTGSGVDDISMYSWLPFKCRPTIIENTGTQIKCIEKHPFYQYFRTYSDSLRYEGVLGTGTLKSRGKIAVNNAGSDVAAEVQAEAGAVIFLPQVSSNDPQKDGAVMINCIRNTLHKKIEIDPPSWAGNYHLPGEDKHKDEINTLTSQISELINERDKLVEKQEEIAEYVQLLYETGKFELEPIVRKAFRLIGFSVPEPDSYDEDYDIILELDGKRVAIAECEGTEEQVDVWKYRQLLDYIDYELTNKGRKLKGVLVGNGYRLTDPKERDVQFTEKALRGAKSQNYCVLSTTELFRLVCAVLKEPENEAKKKILRDSILSATSLFTFNDIQT